MLLARSGHRIKVSTAFEVRIRVAITQLLFGLSKLRDERQRLVLSDRIVVHRLTPVTAGVKAGAE